MSQPNEKRSNPINSWKLIAIISIFSLILLFLPYNIVDEKKNFGFTINLSKYADFAQFVSGITAPILSLCAIYLVYKTYVSQKEELVATNKTMELQRFENTFFQMLNLQQEIISKIETRGKGSNADQKYQGRESIRETKNHLIRHLHSKLKDENNKGQAAIDFLSTDKYYNGFYKEYESTFNHYFRHLYYIYKHVYFSSLSELEKKKYADLIGAQISQDEFYLIFFNATLEGYGYPKFAYLLKEYDVFRNFRDDEIEFSEVSDYVFDLLKKVEYPFK